jgi:hypothetical protein
MYGLKRRCENPWKLAHSSSCDLSSLNEVEDFDEITPLHDFEKAQSKKDWHV